MITVKNIIMMLLTRRAQLVYDSLESLPDKNKYLDDAFSKNYYSSAFIMRNTYRTTEPSETKGNPSVHLLQQRQYPTSRALLSR